MKISHLSRIMCEAILYPRYGVSRFFTSKLFIDLPLQRSNAGIDTFLSQNLQTFLSSDRKLGCAINQPEDAFQFL